MEFRQLRYFTEFAASGSLSEAARRLFITQPAISRQVKLLEEELGTQLLMRKGNAAKLTPEGEVFYDEAKDLLEHMEKVLQRVRGLRNETLRIGYVSSLVSALVPQVLVRFRALAKKVRVELLDLNPAEICAAAKRREIEVAIVPRGFEDQLEEFEMSEICRLRPVLVMRKADSLAKLRSIDPGTLSGARLLGLNRAGFPEYAPRLRAILKPFGIRPKLISETADGMPTLFADLVALEALAVLTDGIEDSLPPALVTRKFSPPLADLPIFAGVSAVSPNAQAQAFLKLLHEEGRKSGGRKPKTA